MPRIPNESAALLADLMSRLGRVVDVALAEGRAQALVEIRSLVGSGVGVATKRGPGRPRGSRNKPKAGARRRSGKPRKNPWAGLSPAERLARVNAIRKGRGLPPKSE